MKNLILVLATVLTLSSARAADVPAPLPEPRSGWDFSEAASIPVQSGGRVKPLDSFAREMVLFETGSREFQDWKPIEMIFSWMVNAAGWDQVPFIQITRADLKRELGLEEGRTRFAPQELYKNSALAQYATHLPPEGAPQSDRDKELRRVLDRLGAFRSVVAGEAWLVVPPPTAADATAVEGDAWLSLAVQTDRGKLIREKFVDFFHAYQTGNADAFAEGAHAAKLAVQAAIPGWDDRQARVIDAERFYNVGRPFHWAWILYLLVALGGGFTLATKRASTVPLVLLTGAVVAHLTGIGLRCFIAGRPPVTNMYESILWVSFGVVLFATVIYALQRQVVVLIVASALACFGLIAADSAPAMIDPGIHPLVPVLRSNYWLTIHVLTITLGYSAFALAFGMGDVSLYQYLKRAVRGEKTSPPPAQIASLNQLTYRAMQFGVVLLAAGTILGGVWADYSWGRFWGWDPKEVWALIALLCYLVILHGRFAGWVGQFGFAAWSVISFISVVMAWYGVNFVLGVGKHTYGFASGGRGWVALFVGAEIAYVLLVTYFVKRKPPVLSAPSSVAT